MNQEEHAILIDKLDLKLQYQNLVYVIIMMQIYMLKEI